MDVVSLCALRASGFEWQPTAGAYALTVICKATFGLRPDECALDPEQEDPSDTDTYWNDDAARSLVVPSDRAPYKPRADVVLVGHAYAPKREPARAIMTRLLVGEIDKSIEVWSDRGVQTHAGQLFQGPRQVKMLLTWERAAGGPETSNPVGMRFDAAPDRFGMIPVPNLQPPGIHFGELGDTFEPVGYGPIAPHWPTRTQKLYGHAASFPAYGWERRPLPEPFDYGYFNVAPPDQQIAELRPNERIVLENLHPQHERIVTSLPEIRPRAVADRATGEREEVALKADTLWIDTDRGICTVVWRGLIALRHPGEAGRVAFWVHELPMNSATISAPTRGPAAPIVQEETWDPNRAVRRRMVTAEVKDHERPALPFVKGAPAPPPPVGLYAAAAPPFLGPLAKSSVDDEVTETFTGTLDEQAKDTLPFAYGAGAPPNIAGELVASSMPEPADGGVGETTGPIFAAAFQTPSTPMPFRAQSAVQPAPPAPPSPPAPPPQPPPRAFIAMGAPLAFPVRAEPNASRGEAPAAVAPVIEAPKENIAPPPMMGPLAVPEIAPPPEAKPPEVVHANGAPPATPAAEEPAAPAEKKPNPDAFPVERCGALTARIALNKPDKARILEEEELSPDHWAAVENHWAAAIRDETKKGKKTRLEQFDGAYVEQLEKERGPIEARGYARLMVAGEREATDSVLKEMGLPRGALMRIERVWLKRLVKDPALMEKVAEAMESERNSGS